MKAVTGVYLLYLPGYNPVRLNLHSYFFSERKRAMLHESNGQGQQTKKRKNRWQFRDQVTPARIAHLLMKRKITSTDLLLFWLIGSLVRPQGRRSGLGCWASNAGFAKWTGLNPTYISQRISFLAKRGLILIVTWNGKRYLELEWSRTAEERDSLEGEYGKLLRKTHAELEARMETKRALGKPKGDPLGKPKRGVRENLKQIGIDRSIKGKEKEGGRQMPPVSPLSSTSSLNGKASPPQKNGKVTAGSEEAEAHVLSGKLTEVLSRHKPNRKSEPRKGQISAMKELLKEVGEEGWPVTWVPELIDKFDEHFASVHKPHVRSVKEFCNFNTFRYLKDVLWERSGFGYVRTVENEEIRIPLGKNRFQIEWKKNYDWAKTPWKEYQKSLHRRPEEVSSF